MSDFDPHILTAEQLADATGAISQQFACILAALMRGEVEEPPNYAQLLDELFYNLREHGVYVQGDEQTAIVLRQVLRNLGVREQAFEPRDEDAV